MKRLIAAAAVLTLTAGVALAAPSDAKKADPAKTLCPVTREEIGKITPETQHSEYKGKTYYFCCTGCKPQFDKNPAKYAKADPKPAKPARNKKS